jgi:hypothetical protein
MLAHETLEAFLGTSNSAAAWAFYEGVLGLTFAGEHEHLVEFDAGGPRLRLQKLDKVTPPFGTALGWRVRDLKGTIRALAAKGVEFSVAACRTTSSASGRRSGALASPGSSTRTATGSR